MRSPRLRLATTIAASIALAIGCGGGRGEAHDPAHDSPIARVHRAHCGNCHHRVDPDQRTRAELEIALRRHRKRVHLSEADWGSMLDYLAPAPQLSATAPSAQPQ